MILLPFYIHGTESISANYDHTIH